MPALHPTYAGAPSWVLGADQYPAQFFAVSNRAGNRMCELKTSRAALVYIVEIGNLEEHGAVYGAVCYGDYLYCLMSSGLLLTWSIVERRITRVTTVFSGEITATCTLVSDGEGSLYFAFDLRLYRVSVATGLVDRTIVIWETARTVAVDATYVYVGEQFGCLEQFSRATGAFVQRLDFGSGSFYAIVADGTSRVYAARNSPGLVYEIATSTFSVQATITVGTNPRNLGIDGNGVVWCSNQDSNTVSIIQNSVVTRTLTGLSKPTAIAFDRQKRVYVANAPLASGSRRVIRYNMDTFEVERQIYFATIYIDLLVWNGKTNPLNG